METLEKKDLVLTKDQLLAHWQGHRALTRRVIESFPEDKLFSFSLGGMRTFGELASEMIGIAVPGVRGLATNNWETLDEKDPSGGNKTKLLEIWDRNTGEIDEWFAKIPEGRLQETMVAFGLYENKGYCTLLYFIDNEIHHRGQGYVYLRALGIEPPAFWER